MFIAVGDLVILCYGGRFGHVMYWWVIWSFYVPVGHFSLGELGAGNVSLVNFELGNFSYFPNKLPDWIHLCHQEHNKPFHFWDLLRWISFAFDQDIDHFRCDHKRGSHPQSEGIPWIQKLIIASFVFFTRPKILQEWFQFHWDHCPDPWHQLSSERSTFLFLWLTLTWHPDGVLLLEHRSWTSHFVRINFNKFLKFYGN